MSPTNTHTHTKVKLIKQTSFRRGLSPRVIWSASPSPRVMPAQQVHLKLMCAADVRTACGCDNLDVRGVSVFIWLGHNQASTNHRGNQTKPMFKVPDVVARNPKMTYSPGPVLDSNTGMLQPVIGFKFTAQIKTFNFLHGNLNGTQPRARA